MNARLILALLVLTVLGVGAALLLLQDESADEGPGATVGIEEPATARPAALPEGRASSTPEALPTAGGDAQAVPIPGDRTSPARIVGRVVTRSGVPVPDAEVTCFAVGTTSAWLQYQPTGHRAATDAEGAFRLLGVPTTSTLALEVAHETAAPTVLEPLRATEGEELDVGDIRLDPGVRMTGRVLDPQDQPVAGAVIVVADLGRAMPGGDDVEPTVVAEAVSGSDGSYVLEHLGRRQYTVDIDADGFAPLQSVVAFLLNDSMGAFEQDYVLEPTGLGLGGVVLGPNEEPVVGARIELVRRVPNNNAYYLLSRVTDDRGGFFFDRIAAGRYEVRFSSTDWYLPLPEKLDAGRDDHVLRAQPAITVVGTIVTDGKPPAQYTVAAQPDARTGATMLGDLPRERTFRDDGSGTFEFGGLRSGTYVLTVSAPGFAPTESQDLVLGQEALRVPVTVVLRPGGTVVGRLDPADPPAVVELRDGSWDPNGPLDFAFPTQPVHGLRAKTAESGAFRLRNVPEGDYVLSVKTPGLPDLHVRDVSVADDQVVDLGVLVRGRGGVVRGKVVGTDGQPLGGANLTLTGDAARLRTTSNVDGTFRFDAVPEGEYELVAVPKAFFQAFSFEARVPVSVEAGEEQEFELFLEKRAPSASR